MRESSVTQSLAALLNDDPSSDRAPFCNTMAFPTVPLARSARRNPLAMDSNPTKTATTSPIPIMARSVDFHRTTRLRKLEAIRSALLAPPQQFGDSCAICENGRKQTRYQPQRHAND